MDTSFEISKASSKSQPKNVILFAIILLVLVAAGLYFYNLRTSQASVPVTTVVSQRALEDQYGLRVNLVAVTAAGGMVDVRFQIVNGEKAKALLQDKKNFPALYIRDANITLNASEDAKAQEIKFEDGNDIFLLYSNAGNSVKSGSSVSVMFGDIALEPIIAK